MEQYGDYVQASVPEGPNSHSWQGKVQQKYGKSEGSCFMNFENVSTFMIWCTLHALKANELQHHVKKWFEVVYLLNIAEDENVISFEDHVEDEDTIPNGIC